MFSAFFSGITVTKDHPDENYPHKWICSHKHALLSSLVTGILVCSLLTLILVIKYNTGGNHYEASGKLITFYGFLSRAEFISLSKKHSFTRTMAFQ